MAVTQPYSLPTTAQNPFYVQYARVDGAMSTKKNVISGLGATRTLLAEESGSLIILDRAAGIALTLPAPVIGLVFDFLVAVTVTTNAYKIITDAATTFLIGQYLNVDIDSANANIVFSADGTTIISLNLAGTTKGGFLGSAFRFTCVSSTLWLVEGLNNANGTVVTAFATT